MCSVYESEPDECIKQCQSLLDEPNLDTAIRMGDVFGLIIEHYGQTGSYQKVRGCLVQCLVQCILHCCDSF